MIFIVDINAALNYPLDGTNLPNVELRFVWNIPLQSLIIKLDFPTAASPAKTILYILSGAFCARVTSDGNCKDRDRRTVYFILKCDGNL